MMVQDCVERVSCLVEKSRDSIPKFGPLGDFHKDDGFVPTIERPQYCRIMQALAQVIRIFRRGKMDIVGEVGR